MNNLDMYFWLLRFLLLIILLLVTVSPVILILSLIIGQKG